MVEKVALTEDQEIAAGRIITNLRRQPLTDPRAQSLSEEWVRASFVLSREVKDQIGILWMEKVMGADEETIRGFREERGGARDKVGKLWDIKGEIVDLAGFWEGVAKVYHQLGREGLDFLINNK